MAAETETTGPTSFRGRRWAFPDAAGQGVSVSATLMRARGIPPEGEASFLSPSLKDTMPNPHSLKDMKAAASRISRAVRNGERIGIWSDYDADGATSAAILIDFLRMCGHDDVRLRIPDRVTEGYGPNIPGLLAMQRDEGCNLVVILDAGTVAFEPLEAARDAGMEIVVLDHHAAEPVLPPAIAIVNPNRQDETPGLGHLCAAGVTFLCAVAVSAELRRAAHFDGRDGRPAEPPRIGRLLDLVALGTVCDVVPLTGVNRAFVHQGCKILSGRGRPGIAALAAASGIDPGAPIGEKECGWQLGPRINAAGRIGDPMLGALLLIERDPSRAEARARDLAEMNVARKGIEAKATDAAQAVLVDRPKGARTLVLAVVEDAHEGVVGITAGRLREAHGAPAIVLTRDESGNLKGSARSVPGFDIGRTIMAARNAGLLVKGGGHGMAAGLTIEDRHLGAFRDFMDDAISRTDYARDGIMDCIDVGLPLADLTVDVVLGLQALRPYGSGNPEPSVAVVDVEISAIRILKDKHLKVTLTDDRDSIEGLLWNAVGTPMGDAVMAAEGARVDAMGRVEINEYRGRKHVQMILEDMGVAMAPVPEAAANERMDANACCP